MSFAMPRPTNAVSYFLLGLFLNDLVSLVLATGGYGSFMWAVPPSTYREIV